MGGAEAAKRTKTCDGKRATIVSDAATIVGTMGHDVIVGGPGANTIRGEGGNDTICGGGGNDTIDGGRGNDRLFGEGGDDVLDGDRGSDLLDGGAGGDRLHGGLGNDDLRGGPGDGDQLDAGAGDDTLDGGSGHGDVLTGGPGNDSIDGGPGARDLASYREAAQGVRIDLAAGVVSGAEGESLRGIEDAVAGPGSVICRDGGRCEPAIAGASTQTPELHVSVDRTSALILTGGPGSDRAVVSVSGGAFLVAGHPGGAPVVAGEGCVRAGSPDMVSCAAAVESIVAALAAGDDELTIDASVPAAVDTTLDGGAGSDRLLGGLGDDTIYGGDDRDDDVLEGGPGDDVLYGVNILHPRQDSGAARMIGGLGDDLLVGGQPCGGDYFEGGPGANDSASFARIRNEGIHVEATIGGAVRDPDLGRACEEGFIDASVEKIEGSPGPDILFGSPNNDTLLGRGGNDLLDGRAGFDRCIVGTGRDTLRACEVSSWRAALRRRIR